MSVARPPVVVNNRLLLLVSVATAATIVFFPARQMVAQRRHMADLRTRLTQLRTENQALEREAQRLEDSGKLEVLARERFGLVRPGERAYFIEQLRPKPQRVQDAKHGTSTFGRAWHWLVSVIRGGQ